jgi:dTDP-4-amino-4,6-dideoxy-D-galactose acyltransferase
MNHLMTRSAKFYPSLNFLTNDPALCSEWFDELALAVSEQELTIFKASNGVELFIRHLAWDSNFFETPTFRIDYSYIPAVTSDTHIAFEELFGFLSSRYETFYLFSEVPSEDIETISGLTGAGYRLIETRFTYFHDQIKNFDPARRYATRQANKEDIVVLSRTAIDAVNEYDRFHADSFFSSYMANNFLGKYVENSVLGYADEVLVPSEGIANAFLTGNYIHSPSCLDNKKIAKMVLSAVAPERRGWYVKLIGEMTMRFKEKNIDIAFMTTQSTNRAVIKVWNSFGYKFGRCTHIFSKYKR